MRVAEILRTKRVTFFRWGFLGNPAGLRFARTLTGWLCRGLAWLLALGVFAVPAGAAGWKPFDAYGSRPHVGSRAALMQRARPNAAAVRPPRLHARSDLRVKPGANVMVVFELAAVEGAHTPQSIRIGLSPAQHYAWATPDPQAHASAARPAVETTVASEKGVSVATLPVCPPGPHPVVAVVHYQLLPAASADPLAGLTLEPGKSGKTQPPLCLLRGTTGASLLRAPSEEHSHARP